MTKKSKKLKRKNKPRNRAAVSKRGQPLSIISSTACLSIAVLIKLTTQMEVELQTDSMTPGTEISGLATLGNSDFFAVLNGHELKKLHILTSSTKFRSERTFKTSITKYGLGTKDYSIFVHLPKVIRTSANRAAGQRIFEYYDKDDPDQDPGSQRRTVSINYPHRIITTFYFNPFSTSGKVDLLASQRVASVNKQDVNDIKVASGVPLCNDGLELALPGVDQATAAGMTWKFVWIKCGQKLSVHHAEYDDLPQVADSQVETYPTARKMPQSRVHLTGANYRFLVLPTDSGTSRGLKLLQYYSGTNKIREMDEYKFPLNTDDYKGGRHLGATDYSFGLVQTKLEGGQYSLQIQIFLKKGDDTLRRYRVFQHPNLANSINLDFNELVCYRPSFQCLYITDNRDKINIFKVPDEAMRPCPAKTYDDGSDCSPCSKLDGRCLECGPGESDLCSECSEGSKPSETGLTCVCEDGWYERDKECFKCSDEDEKCLKCRLQPAASQFECTECETDYKPLQPPSGPKKCLLDCSKYSGWGECLTCDLQAGCLTCKDNNRKFARKSDSKQICSKCAQNQAVDNSNGAGDCFDCLSPPTRECDSCTHIREKGKFSLCLSCLSGFELNDRISGVGDVQCAKGPGEGECMTSLFELPYTECAESHEKCLKCFRKGCRRLGGDLNLLRCEVCQEGYRPATEGRDRHGCLKICPEGSFLVSQDNTCYRCSEAIKGCSECSEGPSSSKNTPEGVICSKCDPNLVKFENRCLECGEHPEGSKGLCQTCQASEESPDGKFKCESCQKGHFLNESNECQKECPESGFGWIPDNNCGRCATNCLDCRNTTLECTRCEEKYKKSSNKPTECELDYLGEVEVEVIVFDKAEHEISVKFNQKIKEKEFGKILDFDFFEDSGDAGHAVEVENSSEATDVTPMPLKFATNVSISKNLKNLIFRVEFPENGFKGSMLIKHTGEGTVEALNTPRTYFRPKKIKKDQIDFYSDAVLEALNSIKPGVQAASLTLNAVLVVSYPPIGIIFLRIMATFAIYRFINIDLPANVEAFFKYFDRTIMDLLPNLNLAAPQKTDLGCKTYKTVFGQNGDCLGANNGFLGLLAQPVVYSCLKFISRWISAKKSLTFRAVQLKFLTVLCLNSLFLLKMPLEFFLSSLLGTFVLATYYGFAITTGVASNKLEQPEKVKNDKKSKKTFFWDFWIFLKSELSDDAKGITRHFMVLNLLKDVITTASIIWFMKISPIAQILLPMAYNAFIAALLGIKRPLGNKKHNYLKLFTCASEVVVLLIFLSFLIFSGMSEKFRYKVLGNALICTMFAVFVVLIVLGFVFSVIRVVAILRGSGGAKGRKEGAKTGNGRRRGSRVGQVFPKAPDRRGRRSVHQRAKVKASRRGRSPKRGEKEGDGKRKENILKKSHNRDKNSSHYKNRNTVDESDLMGILEADKIDDSHQKMPKTEIFVNGRTEPKSKLKHSKKGIRRHSHLPQGPSGFSSIHKSPKKSKNRRRGSKAKYPDNSLSRGINHPKVSKSTRKISKTSQFSKYSRGSKKFTAPDAPNNIKEAISGNFVQIKHAKNAKKRHSMKIRNFNFGTKKKPQTRSNSIKDLPDSPIKQPVIIEEQIINFGVKKPLSDENDLEVSIESHERPPKSNKYMKERGRPRKIKNRKSSLQS